MRRFIFFFSVDHTANPTPIFQFGSKETTSLSFASLFSQTGGFAKDNKEDKAFIGTGRKLFGQPSNEDGEEDYDPEKEVGGADFKPIVSLPAIVDVQTGEEDENVIYSHRAKLYRFDHEIKQWKERGVGDIKILVNPETNRCRVVMRRDQIHKLCANHFITCEMELKENAGSDRSWVWSVNADFADGIAKAELLAVRFRHAEDAVMFQVKFKECQETFGEPKENESGGMERASPVVTERNEDEKDNDNNVEVKYKKSVEHQEKVREPKEDSQTEKAELASLSAARKEGEGDLAVSDYDTATHVTREGEEAKHFNDDDAYQKLPSVEEKDAELPETIYVEDDDRKQHTDEGGQLTSTFTAMEKRFVDDKSKF